MVLHPKLEKILEEIQNMRPGFYGTIELQFKNGQLQLVRKAQTTLITDGETRDEYKFTR